MFQPLITPTHSLSLSLTVSLSLFFLCVPLSLLILFPLSRSLSKTARTHLPTHFKLLKKCHSMLCTYFTPTLFSNKKQQIHILQVANPRLLRNFELIISCCSCCWCCCKVKKILRDGRGSEARPDGLCAWLSPVRGLFGGHNQNHCNSSFRPTSRQTFKIRKPTPNKKTNDDEDPLLTVTCLT